MVGGRLQNGGFFSLLWSFVCFFLTHESRFIMIFTKNKTCLITVNLVPFIFVGLEFVKIVQNWTVKFSRVKTVTIFLWITIYYWEKCNCFSPKHKVLFVIPICGLILTIRENNEDKILVKIKGLIRVKRYIFLNVFVLTLNPDIHRVTWVGC